MYYCPKCKKELKDETVKFCPYCGFDFHAYALQMKDRFTKDKKRYYGWMILVAFLISLIGILASFFYTQYYIYIIFVAISWYIVLFLGKYIGRIDVVSIDSQIKKYLRKLSIPVFLINIMNIVTVIQTVIALINK